MLSGGIDTRGRGRGAFATPVGLRRLQRPQNPARIRVLQVARFCAENGTIGTQHFCGRISGEAAFVFAGLGVAVGNECGLVVLGHVRARAVKCRV